MDGDEEKKKTRSVVARKRYLQNIIPMLTIKLSVLKHIPHTGKQAEKKSKIPKKENYFYNWTRNKINNNLIKTSTFSFAFVSANIFRTFLIVQCFFSETKLKIIH